MKTLKTIVLIVSIVLSLTSCTDTSDKGIELERKQILNGAIEPGEIEDPGDRGND